MEQRKLYTPLPGLDKMWRPAIRIAGPAVTLVSSRTEEIARKGSRKDEGLVVEASQEIIERASVCFNYNWPETEVVVAESGSEATKLLDHHRPDMVVLGMGTAAGLLTQFAQL